MKVFLSTTIMAVFVFATASVGLCATGDALYTSYCVGCHGPLATSSKAGASAQTIQSAITSNMGGMGMFSTLLTAADVQAIAGALAPAPVIPPPVTVPPPTTLPPPTTVPPPVTVPPAPVIEGGNGESGSAAQFGNQACAQCHASNGDLVRGKGESEDKNKGGSEIKSGTENRSGGSGGQREHSGGHESDD